MSLRQGDIYYGFVQGTGVSHRLLIVSRDELNRGRYVVTVAFTSAQFTSRAKAPNCVFFPRGSHHGLDEDCVMQGESIAVTPVHHLDFVTGVLGQLPREIMEQVIAAIGYVLSASYFLQD